MLVDNSKKGSSSGAISIFSFFLSAWEVVGTAGFSTYMVYEPSIAVNQSNGDLFVTYIESVSGIYKLSCNKFNGTSWVDVGTPEFQVTEPSGKPGITINNSGNPVIVTPGSIGFQVFQFNGTTWDNLTAGASTAANPTSALDILYQFGSDGAEQRNNYFPVVSSNGDIYIAVRSPLLSSNGIKLMKYSSGTWSQVGNNLPGAEWVQLQRVSIAPNGDMYVSYSEMRASSSYCKIHVYKWSGTSWVDLTNSGTAIFNSTYSNFNSFSFDIAFDSSSIPYVVYQNTGIDWRAYVKKYNSATSTWDMYRSGQVGGISVDAGIRLFVNNTGLASFVTTSSNSEPRIYVPEYNPFFNSSSFSPASGLVGTPVYIYGGNFTGTTDVKFNGVSTSFTVNSNTTITATVPANATSGTISVTNASGTSTTSSSYTVIIPPTTITSLSTYSAKVGDPIYIYGSNFDSTITNNEVYFGGMKATILEYNNSPVSLKVTVPGGTGSTERITVINKTNKVSVKHYRQFNITKALNYPTSFNKTFEPSTAKTITSSSLFTSSNNSTISRKNVKAADINGDGKPDLIYVNSSGKISFLINTLATSGAISNSDFTLSNFDIDTGIASATSSGNIELHDMNNDGLLDIVFSHNDGVKVYSNTSVGATLSFNSPVLISRTGPAIAIGDYDKDGYLDIALANYTDSQNSNRGSINIFRNTTIGNTLSYSTTPVLTITYDNQFRGAMVASDLNNDGYEDIIIAGESTQAAMVFMNNTTSTTIAFTTGIGLTGGLSVRQLASADINADGYNDLILGNNSGGRSVYINQSGNASAATYSTSSFSRVVYDTATGWEQQTNAQDINGDAKVDISDGNGFYYNSSTGGTTNTNNFTFKYYSNQDATSPLFQSFFVDLDLDGKPDFVSSIGSGNITVTRNTLDEPYITSFTPQYGTANTESITIIGERFTGATSVLIGGIAVQSFTVDSATKITAVIGAGSTGPITVITPSGRVNSLTNFTFNPSITTSISAFANFSKCPTGAGASQSFNITGNNLQGPITFVFNNNNAVSSTKFEYSFDNLNFVSFAATPLVLTPVNGVVANTTIYVRVNGTAPDYENLKINSTNVTTIWLTANSVTRTTPTITLGNISNISSSATSFNIPYTAVTNSPTTYSVATGTSALANYTPIVDASFTGSTGNLAVAVPVNKQQGNYDFNITVKNTYGCQSSIYSKTATVLAPPPTVTSSSNAINLHDNCKAPRVIADHSQLSGNITLTKDDVIYVQNNNPRFVYFNAADGNYYGNWIYTSASSMISSTTAATLNDFLTTNQGAQVLSVNFPGSSFQISNFNQLTGEVNSIPSLPYYQNFTVSGQYLTNEITVTPPTNFQISTDLSTWIGTTTTPTAITLTPTTGTVAATAIYTRTTPSLAAGSYTGNIAMATLGGAATTKSVSATIAAVPVISSQPTSNVAVCKNASATLAITVTDGTYQWFSNTTPTIGGTSLGTSNNAQTASLTLPTANVGTNYYYCVITNSCGSITSAISTVVVEPLSVAGTASGTSTICSGTTTSLSLSGNTGTIQWEKSANGTSGWTAVTDGTGATTASYTTPPLNTTTYYRAAVTSGSCSVNYSNVIQVTIPVVALPTVSSTINLCKGETAAALTATALTGHSLQWYTAATNGTASTTAPTPSATTVGSTRYYVSQKNDTSGCEGLRAAIEVVVTDLPVAPTATQTINYGLGDAATALTATATNGSDLLWYTVATGGTASTTAPIPSTVSVGATIYYVSQKEPSGPFAIDNPNVGSYSGVTNMGQSFVLPRNMKLNSIELKKSFYNDANTISTLKIYDRPPTTNTRVRGNVIATADATYINNASGWTTNIPFSFANQNVVLTAGQEYYFEITTTGNMYAEYSAPYADGFAYIDAGKSTNDFAFKLNATLISNPCESARTAITVNVNILPAAPTVANATLSYCAGETATALSATVLSGHTLQWYTVATGGTASLTAPVPSTNVTGTTIYYVSQKDDATGVESHRTSITVTITPGLYAYDRAMNFSGGGKLSKATNASLNSANFTLEAWIYPTAFNEGAGIISKGDYQLRTQTNGKLCFMIERQWSWEQLVTPDNTIVLNQWQHVVATYNGSTKEMKIFVDGVMKASYTRTQGFVPDFTWQELSIGYNNGYGGDNYGNGSILNRYFDGNIDEVKIWNVVKTPSEIASNYANQLAGNETGLVAYYKFDQGIGGGNNTAITSFVDQTSNANHLTPVGMPRTGVTNNILQIGAAISGPSVICLNETATITHTHSGGTWTSSDNSIISIDSSTGVVTTNAVGAATITYSFSQNACNFSSSKLITVNDAPIISNAQAMTIGGATLQLTATTAPASTNPWISSNSAVATVSNTGVVSALTVGTTTITYTNTNGCTDTETISVVLGTTQTPILTSPATNTTGATTLQINYSLPEAPLAGSVHLIFTPSTGGTPIMWTMNNATTANFAYVVGTAPTTISNVVSGIALEFTTYDLTLSYQDALNSPAASVTNTSIQTLAPPSLTLSPTSINGMINLSLSTINLTNSGGAISSFVISPSLPAGLSFDTTTGAITGTPTAAIASTIYTITATNPAGIGNATFTLFIDADTDGDGVPDSVEVQQGTSPITPGARDTDGDGVPDYVEIQQGTNPTTPGARDTDGDGVPDYIEIQQGTNPTVAGDTIDTDSDGISDYIELQQGTNPAQPGDVLIDTDGDGVPNFVEGQQGTNSTIAGDVLDTDHDGVPDYVEIKQGTNPTIAGDALDTDHDGVPDYVEIQQGTNPSIKGALDSDHDGVPNFVEIQQGTNPNLAGDALDTDGDGVPDYIELQQGTNPVQPGDVLIDSDGDGVPNFVEVQQGTNPTIAGDALDTDHDGVPDYVEIQQGTNPTVASDALDTDHDGVPNYVEIQQGTNPTIAGDALDSDHDGVPNFVEIQQGTNPTLAGDPLDSDHDGVPNYVEIQQGTNPTIASDALDTDHDGVPNYVEIQQGTNPTIAGDALDTDHDGVPDYVEIRQGTNPSLVADALDTDHDGVPDYVEIRQGTNPSLVADALDTDHDGVPDYVEIRQGTNPNVVSDALDTDHDGVPDYVEITQGTNPNVASDALDTDHDGVPDYVEIRQGTNPNVASDALDTDHDGVPDYIEIQQGTNSSVLGDYLDTDGDGVPDYVEIRQGTNPNVSGALDTDYDGIPDYIELQQGTDPANRNNYLDTDGDGVPDYIEIQQGTNPNVVGARDTDGDGIPDYVELWQGTNPNASGDVVIDTDGDGVPDYIELQQGTNPLVANVFDADQDGIVDSIEKGTDLLHPLDTDVDGIPNYRDVDSDNDGILDANEKGSNAIPADTDRDGVPDYLDLESDGDGVKDSQEIIDHTNANNACDSVPAHVTVLFSSSFLSGDCDGDGLTNSEELGGNPTLPTDVDNNGTPDYLEFNNHGVSEDNLEIFNSMTNNGDALNDVFVIRGIEQYPNNTLTIYSRWGTEVYNVDGYGQDDKYFRGISEGRQTISQSAELPKGTYFYILRYVKNDGVEKQRSGYLYITK